MVMVDYTDTKSEDDLVGFRNPKPGRYHAIVENVDDSFTHSDNCLIVDFSILAGTVTGQENTTVKDRIPVSGNGAKRSAKFALSTNLMRPSDLGKSLDIDFRQAEGRQLVIDVIENKYKNKQGQDVVGAKIDFAGFHAIGSKDAEGVPLSSAVPNIVNGSATASSPAGNSAGGSSDKSGWGGV